MTFYGTAEVMMRLLTRSSLILLCYAMGAALGGGLYESIVLVPLWSKSPPASFAIIQPGTGVPLQSFWIPVHVAITLFMVAAIAFTWRDRRVRRWLLAGAASYVVMRAWSAVFFIPEMLAFQQSQPLRRPRRSSTRASPAGSSGPYSESRWTCFRSSARWRCAGSGGTTHMTEVVNAALQASVTLRGRSSA